MDEETSEIRVPTPGDSMLAALTDLLRMVPHVPVLHMPVPVLGGETLPGFIVANWICRSMA